MRELEKRRADLWQQAAHDLRGNLGVVSNVAQGLSLRDLPGDRRDEFVALLSNNVSALRRLLDDVTVLARLQAGQEERRVAPFDAAEVLAPPVRRRAAARRRQEACRSGPSARTTLQVEGDAIKVRRIAQNLLLNALKYTRAGGVVLAWGDAAPGDCAPLEPQRAGQRAGLPFRAGRADRQCAQSGRRRRADRAAAHPMPPSPRRATTTPGRSTSRRAKVSAWRSSSACATCSTPSSSSRPWSSKGTTVRVLLPRRYATPGAAATKDGGVPAYAISTSS